MSETRDVCLVDGFGRPRIVLVAAGLVLPASIRYTRPGLPEACFDQTSDETIDDRPVYRQRGTGTPPIREAYLKLG
jgi:hypothetical protein